MKKSSVGSTSSNNSAKTWQEATLRNRTASSSRRNSPSVRSDDSASEAPKSLSSRRSSSHSSHGTAFYSADSKSVSSLASSRDSSYSFNERRSYSLSERSRGSSQNLSSSNASRNENPIYERSNSWASSKGSIGSKGSRGSAFSGASEIQTASDTSSIVADLRSASRPATDNASAITPGFWHLANAAETLRRQSFHPLRPGETSVSHSHTHREFTSRDPMSRFSKESSVASTSQHQTVTSGTPPMSRLPTRDLTNQYDSIERPSNFKGKTLKEVFDYENSVSAYSRNDESVINELRGQVDGDASYRGHALADRYDLHDFERTARPAEKKKSSGLFRSIMNKLK